VRFFALKISPREKKSPNLVTLQITLFFVFFVTEGLSSKDILSEVHPNGLLGEGLERRNKPRISLRVPTQKYMRMQGCQMFLENIPKSGINIPIDHIMYQMTVKYTK
jgi:hypothetical protein